MLKKYYEILTEVKQLIENIDNDRIEKENIQAKYIKAIEKLDKLKKNLSEDQLVIEEV
jgi:hypothetical protein